MKFGGGTEGGTRVARSRRPCPTRHTCTGGTGGTRVTPRNPGTTGRCHLCHLCHPLCAIYVCGAYGYVRRCRARLRAALRDRWHAAACGVTKQ